MASLKDAGNAALKRGDGREAAALYSQALFAVADDGNLAALLYSNRSAAWLASGEYRLAEQDARAAIARLPEWPKAHVRLGNALVAAGDKELKQGNRRGKDDLVAAVRSFDRATSFLTSADEQQHVAARTNLALQMLVARLDHCDELAEECTTSAWSVVAQRSTAQLDYCSGSSPSSAPFNNCTLLCACAFVGKWCGVKKLLAIGANPDARDAQGSTPLLLASEQGHGKIVRMLLGAKPHGAQPNAPPNNMDERALWCAARAGHLGIVDMLLNKGANIEGRGRMGTTSIGIAASLGHLGVVALLRTRGADTTTCATSSPFFTPVQLARAAQTHGQSSKHMGEIISLLELGSIAKPAEGARNLRACGHCQKEGEGFSRCAGCRVVAYCSRKCQKAAWKIHKLCCAAFVSLDTQKGNTLNAIVRESARQHEATQPKRCAEGEVECVPREQLLRTLRAHFNTGAQTNLLADLGHYNKLARTSDDTWHAIGTTRAKAIDAREQVEACIRDNLGTYVDGAKQPAICNAVLLRWYASNGCDLHRLTLSTGYALLHDLATEEADEIGAGAAIRQLASFGIDLNQPTGRNQAGCTSNAVPLHLAAMYGHIHAIAALLECGADTTRVNTSGRTPLLFGSNSSYFQAAERTGALIEMFELFHHHGADLHAITTPPADQKADRLSYGLTIADYTFEMGNQAAYDWCVAHGVERRDSASRAGEFAREDFWRSACREAGIPFPSAR